MAAPNLPNPMVPPPGVPPYVHHTKIVRAMLEARGIKGRWPEFGVVVAKPPDAAAPPPAATAAPTGYPKPAPKPLRKAQPKGKR